LESWISEKSKFPWKSKNPFFISCWVASGCNQESILLSPENVEFQEGEGEEKGKGEEEGKGKGEG
jgi:hypothetical protein